MSFGCSCGESRVARHVASERLDRPAACRRVASTFRSQDARRSNPHDAAHRGDPKHFKALRLRLRAPARKAHGDPKASLLLRGRLVPAIHGSTRRSETCSRNVDAPRRQATYPAPRSSPPRRAPMLSLPVSARATSGLDGSICTSFVVNGVFAARASGLVKSAAAMSSTGGAFAADANGRRFMSAVRTAERSQDGESEAAGSRSGARRAERRAVREWNVGR